MRDGKPKLIYFPLPMAMWLSVCADLSADQERALSRLIISYATHGFIPNDDRKLANICGVQLRTWLKLKPALEPKFPQEGWRWPFIDEKIVHRQKTAVKKSAAGIAGNLQRWGLAKRH
jgi:uncharacterized protein YdaU (DUF1376 family)